MAYTNTQYADKARARGANVAEYRAAVALDAAVEILRDAAVSIGFGDMETWNTLVNAANHITAESDGVDAWAEAKDCGGLKPVDKHASGIPKKWGNYDWPDNGRWPGEGS